MDRLRNRCWCRSHFPCNIHKPLPNPESLEATKEAEEAQMPSPWCPWWEHLGQICGAPAKERLQHQGQRPRSAPRARAALGWGGRTTQSYRGFLNVGETEACVVSVSPRGGDRTRESLIPRDLSLGARHSGSLADPGPFRLERSSILGEDLGAKAKGTEAPCSPDAVSITRARASTAGGSVPRTPAPVRAVVMATARPRMPLASCPRPRPFRPAFLPPP